MRIVFDCVDARVVNCVSMYAPPPPLAIVLPAPPAPISTSAQRVFCGGLPDALVAKNVVVNGLDSTALKTRERLSQHGIAT
jgi:hypothetical protein